MLSQTQIHHCSLSGFSLWSAVFCWVIVTTHCHTPVLRLLCQCHTQLCPRHCQNLCPKRLCICSITLTLFFPRKTNKKKIQPLLADEFSFSAKGIEHCKNKCLNTRSWELHGRARFVSLNLILLPLARTHVLVVIEWAAGYIGSCSFSVFCALKINNLAAL